MSSEKKITKGRDPRVIDPEEKKSKLELEKNSSNPFFDLLEKKLKYQYQIPKSVMYDYK